MGPALCLLSAACFGAMAIFGKFAYAAGVSPEALVLVRFALAAALLLALLALRPDLGRRPPTAASARSGGVTAGVLLTALGLGAVGYAVQASLYFSALQLMDASLLSLIFYTYPLLVSAAAVLIGRDRLTRRRSAALVIASCGTVLVLVGAGGVELDPLGAALAFGTALAYTAYILVADTVVDRMPPVLLAALVMTGAALTLTARGLLTGGVDLDFGWQAWFWLVCIAVVSTVVAVLTFFAGLRRTGPSSAAVLSTFEPVVTTALAALVLGELLGPVQLVGGLLVLAAVIALQRAPRPQRDDRRRQGAGPGVLFVGVPGRGGRPHRVR